MLLIATIVVLALVTFLVIFIKYEYFFKGKIAENIYIVQRPFKDVYDMKSSGKIIVEDIDGWVVRPNLIYGYFSKTKTYAFSISENKVYLFNNTMELDKYLHERNLPSYDMNDEENIAYLRYNLDKLQEGERKLRGQTGTGQVDGR